MTSTDQTISDPALLAIVGKFLIAEIVEIATFTLLYGIFVLLFAQSTAIFVRKHLSSRAHMWMFLTSVSSFLLATLQGAALLADACVMTRSILVENQDIPLDGRLQLTSILRQAPILLLVWTSAFGPIISDSVVVWRAFVLLKLRCRRWLAILPLFLLWGSIATSLANAVLATMGGDIHDGVVNIIFTAGLRLSLATNVVATALIGYVYWLHRKDTVVLSPGRSRPTQGVRILAILVESGVAFCVPQAIYTFLGFVPQGTLGSVGENIRHVFTIAYFAFAWMYPTVVIILVNRRYTLDQYISDTSLPSIDRVPAINRLGTIQAISFALPEPAASAGEITEQREKKGA